jgi:hypothetical protein
MKLKICLVALSVCLLSSIAHSGSVNSQNLNAEPLEGSPGYYTLAVKFKSVEKVSISTMLPAESLGKKHETIVLPRNDWSYDEKTGLIELKRKIDNSVYIVRAEGKFEIPLRVKVSAGEKASNIRFVYNGKIGKSGADFSYDEKMNEIKLFPCVTGDEKYMLQYSTSKGACSIGSMSSSDMTREIRAYFEWPLDGNSRAIDASCRKFSPVNASFSGVWLVHLLPRRDGYFGKDIIKGFTWDETANILILPETVDLDKYDVYIFGEKKSQDN